MKRKASATLIGSFILLSVALLIAATIILGGTKLFEETKTYVLYFEDSVSGLEIGAPVTFQGVHIGYVSEMNVVVDPDKEGLRVPVYIKVDPKVLIGVGYTQRGMPFLNRLIERGIRAKLVTTSIVTGKLEVEFDFHKGTPIRLEDDTSGYKQIPTIPSGISELAEIMQEAHDTLRSINKLVNSDEVKNILD